MAWFKRSPISSTDEFFLLIIVPYKYYYSLTYLLACLLTDEILAHRYNLNYGSSMEKHARTNFYCATRVHSADYAVARCLSVRLSVCLSVCPSHAGVVCKLLYISSKFFHHRVAPPF